MWALVHLWTTAFYAEIVREVTREPVQAEVEMEETAVLGNDRAADPTAAHRRCIAAQVFGRSVRPVAQIGPRHNSCVDNRARYPTMTDVLSVSLKDLGLVDEALALRVKRGI